MAHVIVDFPEREINPDLLRNALAGRDEELPPSAALSLVGRLRLPGSAQVEFLSEISRNPKIEGFLRAGAVRYLLQYSLDQSLPALTKALEASDPGVAASAAGCLGQAGGQEHLAALRRARSRKGGGEFLARRAAFAEALIVHRLGLPGIKVELPAVPGSAKPHTGARAFVSTNPGPRRRAEAIESVKREFPSLDASRQSVFELQCAERLLEFVFDQSFLGGKDIEARAQRPGLPGFVVFRSVEEEEFYPRYVLLSTPDGKGKVKLLLTTLSGDPVYAGSGKISSEQSTFDLLSVKSPGVTPVASRVRFASGQVEISGHSDIRSLPGTGPAKMKVKSLRGKGG
jgi:hypothetical protein